MRHTTFSALFILSASLGIPSASAGDEPNNGRWSKTPSWARNETPQEHADAAEEMAPVTRNRKPAASMRSSSRISPFAPGSNNLSLDVGQVFLMGSLGDRYTDSIGTRLHYTYGVSDIFAFDSSFGYSGHSEGGLSLSSLLAGLRCNLAWYDKVIPHAVFGLGFYRPSYKESDYSTVLFGVHVGAGVNLELTQSLFFGASMTLHDSFGTDKPLTSGGALPVGGSYTSFFLNAGVSF
ncbi:MAG: hypothetical protein KGQ59_04450 [Bdellovibrionales bacterium]|nr:hypothetical protein [Bdellovibrionales bacterium]